MNKEIVKASKFLSLVLRHKPEAIGLSLDPHGWAAIEDLIELTKDQARPLSRHLIEQAVITSDKQRFKISDDGLRVRANQGHSIEVKLDLVEKDPPEVLYHGTATRFLDSIKSSGLEKRQRQYVHLSADLNTAKKVGVRHGKLVVLAVAACAMKNDGFRFYLSENNVWLTDKVPPEYLSELE